MTTRHLDLNTSSLIALAAAALASSASGQTAIQGPEFNPETNARYYLLQGGTVQQMRTKAAAMGGHLARVENAAENTWLNQRFGNNGLRKFYIGLSDAAVEGTWAWDDGIGSPYRHWAPGEPGSDDFAVLFGNDAGRWYARNATYTDFGVVKIRGDLRVPGEFANIRDAVNHLGSGSTTIAVAEGSYGITSDILLPSLPGGQRGVLRGQGAGTTLILGPTDVEWTMMVYGGWLIEGFTLQSRNSSPMVYANGGLAGGGVTFRGCVLDGALNTPELFENGGSSLLQIERCTLRNAQIGVRSSNPGGRIVLTNTLTRDVIAPVLSFSDSSVVLDGSTFIGQVGVSFLAELGTIEASNSVFSTGSSGLSVSSLYAPPFEYCLLPAASPLAGPGCVIGAAGLDANGVPTPGSRCRDAGSAALASGGVLDLNGNPRVRGGGIDIGAIESEPEPACPVDFNGDGFVDFFDYDDFVAAFETGC
jgi:hypothetical protein